MTSKSRIPTAEEFEAASRHMQRISRGTDTVASEATDWLSTSWPIYRVHLIAEQETSVRTYVFFEKDSDLKSFKSSESSRQFEELVKNSLLSIRGSTQEYFLVSFEYDSAENVDRNFDGDFYARMR